MRLSTDFVGVCTSSATLRLCDLIPPALDILAEHDHETYAAIVDDYNYVDNEAFYDSEDAAWMWHEDLFYALNEIAPARCYFGSHEGDGALMGFWIAHDSLNEDIMYAAADMLPESDHDRFLPDVAGSFRYTVWSWIGDFIDERLLDHLDWLELSDDQLAAKYIGWVIVRDILAGGCHE